MLPESVAADCCDEVPGDRVGIGFRVCVVLAVAVQSTRRGGEASYNVEPDGHVL